MQPFSNVGFSRTGAGTGAFAGMFFFCVACWAWRVLEISVVTLEALIMALTRPGMFDGYTHEGGRDVVGEGDLSPSAFS